MMDKMNQTSIDKDLLDKLFAFVERVKNFNDNEVIQVEGRTAAISADWMEMKREARKLSTKINNP